MCFSEYNPQRMSLAEFAHLRASGQCSFQRLLASLDVRFIGSCRGVSGYIYIYIWGGRLRQAPVKVGKKGVTTIARCFFATS